MYYLVSRIYLENARVPFILKIYIYQNYLFLLIDPLSKKSHYKLFKLCEQ